MSSGIAGIQAGGSSSGAIPGASVTMGGDVTGPSNAAVVVAARGNPFEVATYGLGDTGKLFRWDGAKWAASTAAAAVLPSGTLAALTAPNTFVSRLAAGLTAHDGTEASAAALLGGGMCVVGGAAAATVAYYPTGALAPVGATGWTQDVPLFPNAAGGMVPRGDPSLVGIYSRECGVYDGTFFAVSIGSVEGF